MKSSPVLYTRYPVGSIILYNGVTVFHYLLGGIGLIMGYTSWPGWLLGISYLVFSFTSMYVLMPLRVCPSCPYVKIENSLCISGMNVISRKIAKTGNVNDFAKRARGAFCPNNFYVASLVLPIIILIPALFISFSLLLLAMWLLLVGLLVFRFFFLFTRVVCLHCRAKNICPNAIAMGLARE